MDAGTDADAGADRFFGADTDADACAVRFFGADTDADAGATTEICPWIRTQSAKKRLFGAVRTMHGSYETLWYLLLP